jgi:hypothetical protein
MRRASPEITQVHENRRALPQPACLDCPVSASPVHNRTPRLPTASRSNCGLKQVPPADSLLDLFLSLPGNYESTARRHAIHLFESLISRPPARPAPNAPTTMIQPPPATSSHDPRTGHRIPPPHPPRQPPPHLAAAQSPSERQVHPTASSRYLRRPNINRKTPLPQPKVIPLDQSESFREKHLAVAPSCHARPLPKARPDARFTPQQAADTSAVQTSTEKLPCLSRR